MVHIPVVMSQSDVATRCWYDGSSDWYAAVTRRGDEYLLSYHHEHETALGRERECGAMLAAPCRMTSLHAALLELDTRVQEGAVARLWIEGEGDVQIPVEGLIQRIVAEMLGCTPDELRAAVDEEADSRRAASAKD